MSLLAGKQHQGQVPGFNRKMQGLEGEETEFKRVEEHENQEIGGGICKRDMRHRQTDI